MTPLDLISDPGSVNGDEADRAALLFHASPPQPPMDVLSPTGSSSSRNSGELGGVPRCLSPVPSDPFPSDPLLSNGSHMSGSMSSLDSDTSGSTVASADSHPGESPARGLRAPGPCDVPRSRRHEAEARKAEKRGRERSPDRKAVQRLRSPERR